MVLTGDKRGAVGTRRRCISYSTTTVCSVAAAAEVRAAIITFETKLEKKKIRLFRVRKLSCFYSMEFSRASFPMFVVSHRRRRRRRGTCRSSDAAVGVRLYVDTRSPDARRASRPPPRHDGRDVAHAATDSARVIAAVVATRFVGVAVVW